MCRKPCGPAPGGACICIVVGILILLGLVVPAGFWWLLCAAAFICGGLLLFGRRS